jgi:hypothetical protein
VTVGDVELRGVQQTLIVFDRAFILGNQRALGGKLLFRNGILREQRFITGQVNAGVGEQCLVPNELALGLNHDGFVGSGVDFDKRVALMNVVAFFEVHAEQLAIDPALDGYGIDRGDGAESGNVNSDVTFRRFGYNYWCRAIGATSAGFARFGFRL